MFGLSGGHLLIVAVVVLLLGRNRLPELGSALGRGMHAFKKGLEGRSESSEAEKLTHQSNDKTTSATDSSHTS
jgi:sec-independent protein translocase protein TatA